MLKPSSSILYCAARGLFRVTLSLEVADPLEPTRDVHTVGLEQRKTSRSISARRSDGYNVLTFHLDTPAGNVTSNVTVPRCATVGRCVWVLARLPPPTSRPVKPARRLVTV